MCGQIWSLDGMSSIIINKSVMGQYQTVSIKLSSLDNTSVGGPMIDNTLSPMGYREG